MKETLKIMFFVILAVVYLNIGYKYSKVGEGIATKHRADTFVENVVSGGWNLMYADIPYGIIIHAGTMLFWPVLLVISTVLWIVFWCYQLFLLLIWFIFCGGLYKTVGMRMVVIITILLILSYLIYRIKYFTK